MATHKYMVHTYDGGTLAAIAAATTALVSHLTEWSVVLQEIASFVAIVAGITSIVYHIVKIRSEKRGRGRR